MPPSTLLATLLTYSDFEQTKHMPPPLPNPRSTRFPPGAALLGLATLVAAASLSLALPTAHAIDCGRLAPLGVLAALAATLIALCFRALAAARTRSLLAAALLLAAISLFASARFITRYRAACAGVEQQLRQLKQHASP